MQVTFHGIAAGGEGVGRDEAGRTVFAPQAAPGDLAQVEITEERKNFARGKILHLESASPQRVVPPCPYYLPKDGDETTACGGCQVQHLNYESQLEAKRGIVQNALERIGGFANSPVQECVPSPQQFAYRNKAEFFIGGDGAIGFHARRTHKVVDIAHCPLLQEPLNELLGAVRDLLPRDTANSFETRVDSTGALALRVAWRDGTATDAKEFFAALRERVPSLIDPNRQQLSEEVEGLNFRIGAFDFFQVNSSLTPRLVETALEMAHIEKGTRALDLYCGAGLFGLAMARRGAIVEGVDRYETLNDNAKLNGLQVRASRGAAAKFLNAVVSRGAQCDVALLDPPRAGAAECVEPLIKLRPERIVYVSCDPATLARDLKNLAQNGYDLKRATPLDMFPQTAHVETIGLLERM